MYTLSMSKVFAFFIFQAILFEITTGECPIECSQCKEMKDGPYMGRWNLTERNSTHCPTTNNGNVCLYRNVNNGTWMCFCDPGAFAYRESCGGADEKFCEVVDCSHELGEKYCPIRCAKDPQFCEAVNCSFPKSPNFCPNKCRNESTKTTRVATTTTSSPTDETTKTSTSTTTSALSTDETTTPATTTTSPTESTTISTVNTTTTTTTTTITTTATTTTTTTTTPTTPTSAAKFAITTNKNISITTTTTIITTTLTTIPTTSATTTITIASSTISSTTNTTPTTSTTSTTQTKNTILTSDSIYFIAGGSGTWRDIELYHPTVANPSCSMSPPPLNNYWEYHTTFYYNNTIHLYGGGATASTCISYSTNTEEWKTHTLSTTRSLGHSSTILNKRVYIIGGRDTSYNYVGAESTPLPLTDQPVLTPVLNLDYKGQFQCTTKVDEDTLVVTGGYNGLSYFSSVIEYNAKNHTTTALPSMKQERYAHGCAVVEMNNTKWIIVAGGSDNSVLETTEMLQMGENAWKPLGNLNVARRGHSIVVTQRGVMAVGGRGRIRGFSRGHSRSDPLSSVELLDWNGKSWRMVQPSLSKSRYYFGGAVEIPASMFDCRGTTTTSATIATTTSTTIITTTDETTKTATTTTTALTTSTGVELGTCLNSPGFPFPYPDNSNWNQSLEVPPGQKIIVTFLHFDIEQGISSCPYDYVQFLDASGQPVGPKLCGDSLPQPITIESSTAKVIFRSDGSVTEKGFKLCYSPTDETTKTATTITTALPTPTDTITTTPTTIPETSTTINAIEKSTKTRTATTTITTSTTG